MILVYVNKEQVFTVSSENDKDADRFSNVSFLHLRRCPLDSVAGEQIEIGFSEMFIADLIQCILEIVCAH